MPTCFVLEMALAEIHLLSFLSQHAHWGLCRCYVYFSVFVHIITHIYIYNIYIYIYINMHAFPVETTDVFFLLASAVRLSCLISSSHTSRMTWAVQQRLVAHGRSSSGWDSESL